MNTAGKPSIIVATQEDLRHILSDVIRRELATVVSRPATVKDVINEKEAADYIGQKPGTLRQWRTNSKGPAYHKKGRRVFYKKKDLDAWMAAGRTFTSETPDAPY